jgi:hypothetical protein
VIPQKTISNYKKEIAGWERLISSFQQENVYLKSRLAELVNECYENDMLYSAESFLDDFMSHDKMISFFGDELRLQSTMINNSLSADAHLLARLKENQRRLRMDFKKAEKSFFKMKEGFYQRWREKDYRNE